MARGDVELILYWGAGFGFGGQDTCKRCRCAIWDNTRCYNHHARTSRHKFDDVEVAKRQEGVTGTTCTPCPGCSGRWRGGDLAG